MEFKFRAWYFVTEKAYVANVIDFKNNEIELQDDDGIINAALDTVTLMQYTGVKDVNGRGIYDGDITKGLNRLWEVEVVEKVHYWNGCFMFGNYNAHEFLNKHQHIEVIGNIYDNPQLFKEI